VNPKRWQEIEQLYHAALEREEGQRPEFLARACGDDRELLREVESLLALEPRAGDFLEEGAAKVGAQMFAEDEPRPAEEPLAARLAPHYRLLEKLGEGGMGEVWKARDTRLDRTVAVKFPKRQFSERFRREAQSVAALNHPNICTLYDVGPDYLVTEYVEGRPPKGPLPEDEAVRIGIEIAAALDAAHRQGIVHRDLKPDNILVSKARVKLLDFGLAKPHAAGPRAGPDAASTDRITGAEVMLGTPQYMAPEQVEGKPADARTDIFAFGCVLYELLAGRRAFDGKSPASIIAKILAAEPPRIRESQPAISSALERVVTICLAKEPEDRWQSARDLEHALRGLRDSIGAELGARPYPRSGWIAAGLLLLTAAALGYLALRHTPETGRPVAFSIVAPGDATLRDPRVSPDGERIAFSVLQPGGYLTGGRSQIYVRRLGSSEMSPIPGTEGGTDLFWSPDSRSLGFYADGRVQRVDLAGGQSLTLCTIADVTAANWSRDDVILLGGMSRGLMRVSAQGGTPEPVTRLDPGKEELDHILPVFLPDGKRFLYVARQTRGRLQAKWGSLDGRESGELPVPSGLLQFVPPDYLLFPREGAVFAQELDVKSMKLAGSPRMVAGPVWKGDGGAGSGIYFFSVSGNGVLSWMPAGGPTVSELVWLDASGRRTGVVAPPDYYGSFALSPDNRRVAVGIYDPSTKTSDIWILDVTSGSRTRFTFDPADDLDPVWSPDGRLVAWTSDRRGAMDLYVKPANGEGREEPLLISAMQKRISGWSKDGRYLFFDQPVEGGTGLSIFALPMDRGAVREPLAVRATEFMEWQGQLSPNARFLAYSSNQSGRPQRVYVQPFPATGGRWQVSPSVGTGPQWRADGRELYYVSGNKLMAVPVKTGGSNWEAGVPHVLFEARFVSSSGRRRTRYVPAAGGRFLVNTLPEQGQAERASLSVLVNWLTASGK